MGLHSGGGMWGRWHVFAPQDSPVTRRHPAHSHISSVFPIRLRDDFFITSSIDAPAIILHLPIFLCFSLFSLFTYAHTHTRTHTHTHIHTQSKLNEVYVVGTIYLAACSYEAAEEDVSVWHVRIISLWKGRGWCTVCVHASGM